jgi:NAD/NADP transhydrogenase beta subunit
MAVNIVSVILSVLFGIAYIAVASSGIRVYNECNEIKDSQKWKNMHLLLSNTMVIGIMIPVVLLTQLLAGGKVTLAITMLYGLMGLIGSSVAYNLSREKQCEGISKDSEKNFLLLAIGISLTIMIGAGVFMGTSSSSYD